MDGKINVYTFFLVVPICVFSLNIKIGCFFPDEIWLQKYTKSILSLFSFLLSLHENFT